MIELEDVSFAYDDGPTVFDGLSVAIDAGATTALMGPNGSGKTTLLKLLAALLDPTAGRISVGIDGDATVGFATENPDDGLFAGSVREEVAFFPRNRGLPVESHVQEAMDTMGVTHLAERTPQTLSTGEKRLVLLASVLAGDPDLIALDEPTSGLDTPARGRLGDGLAAIDRTTVFATHDSDFAWEHADTVLVLQDGAVEARGPVDAVLGGDIDLESVGLRSPGPVTWARAHGFDDEPGSVAEAADWLSGGEP